MPTVIARWHIERCNASVNILWREQPGPVSGDQCSKGRIARGAVGSPGALPIAQDIEDEIERESVVRRHFRVAKLFIRHSSAHDLAGDK